MAVIQDITIDLLHPKRTIVRTVQGDNARVIRLTLLANGNPYNVSADLAEGETLQKYVEFRRRDRYVGSYETTEFGDPAVVLESGKTNVWLVHFNSECFVVPGWTQVNVRFETNSGVILRTFAILFSVEMAAGLGASHLAVYDGSVVYG